MDICYATASLQDRKVVDGKPVYEWVASTGREDLNGLILDSAGWDLSHHQKFPLVLLNHRIDELPIARATRTWVQGDELRTTIYFLNTPRALEVQALVDQEVISGMSVGAKPLVWDLNIDANGNFRGIHSHKHILIEESIVTIPANPDSIQVAAGLNDQAYHAVLDPIVHLIRSIKETRQ
jgi:HK97 family phage prohead protease